MKRTVNRAIYAYNEVPPVDVGLAVWRGKVTTDGPPCPANSVGGHPNGPCLAGWIESGDWWLHCGECRPYVACEHDHAPHFAPRTSMTTWKRIDGELIYGDYSFTTERPDEDGDDLDPTEYRKQRWALVSDEVDVIYPTFDYCQHLVDDEHCEADDVTWHKDQDGKWVALCAEHSADVPADDPQAAS